MTTTASDPQIVPRQPPSAPALRAADQGVADALESVLSQNALRVYGTPWCLFTDWCADVGLCSLPAEPLTVPATWPPAPMPAPPSPPCAWPRRPSRKRMSGRSWNRPAGTRACAPL